MDLNSGIYFQNEDYINVNNIYFLHCIDEVSFGISEFTTILKCFIVCLSNICVVVVVVIAENKWFKVTQDYELGNYVLKLLNQKIMCKLSTVHSTLVF